MPEVMPMLKYDDDADIITLSSGRTVYANLGIIGINPELELFEGYDSGLIQDDRLTADDLRELADHMIGLWMKFRETL